jgi:acetyl esterase/lipase
MPSLQARLAKIVVRLVLKNGLSRADTQERRIAATRSLFEFGAARNLRVPRDVRIETVGGPARGEWVRANGSLNRNRAILYVHGGGYVACRPLTHRTLTIALARACGTPVFAVDYRRAPEDPYPAALDDTLRAYDMLRERGLAPGDIAIAGDSAGGGLALATVLALRERDGAPQPVACAVAFSPWTDLLATGASLVTNARSDDMLVAASVAPMAALYAAPEQLQLPLVSPLYGDYQNFPPLLIFASTTEILRDDAVRLAGRARSQGASVTLALESSLPHVWPLFEMLPEARAAVARTAGFIEQHWMTSRQSAAALTNEEVTL